LPRRSFIQHHVAGRRFQIAAEDFHEGGLAAAVGADQAVAVAIAELTEMFSNNGLAPNCMVMLAVESTRKTFKAVN
jgi:hypothetical protein